MNNKNFDDLFKKYDFNSKLTSEQVGGLTTAILGGCLGAIFMTVLSFFGFHVFVNEFIKEMVWQKTFFMWLAILTLANRLKGYHD